MGAQALGVRRRSRINNVDIQALDIKYQGCINNIDTWVLGISIPKINKNSCNYIIYLLR